MKIPNHAKKRLETNYHKTLPCPICKSKTAVLENTKGENTDKRRRICKNGHRFNTLEYITNQQGK